MTITVTGETPGITVDGSGSVVNVTVTTGNGGGGGGGVALGETSTTAYRGDRGKTAYDHSQIDTGNPHGSGLGDLSDVDTTTDPPASGDVLAFDGTEWTPATLDDSLIEIDADQVVSGQLDVARVASGTATDGYVPTVSSGQLVLAAPSGGGSSLLARVAYNPASLATYTISSGTQADVDATNLILPDFTVPASGEVEVIWEAYCSVGTGSTQNWGVRKSTTNLTVDVRVLGAAAGGIRVRATGRVTGLTPGATESGWKWAWSRTNGSNAVSLFAGGSTTTTVGPAVMEVRSV